METPSNCYVWSNLARTRLAKTKNSFISSPPGVVNNCSFFFRQNKPMKSEIEEFCFRREKDACVQVGDVIPGGRYRQLLYPVMAYVHWS